MWPKIMIPTKPNYLYPYTVVQAETTSINLTSFSCCFLVGIILESASLLSLAILLMFLQRAVLS